jgi:hypothetical protein
MQADHRLRRVASGKTELKDTFGIAAPLPILGPIAEALFLRRYMMALNRERNAVIKQVAESDEWRSYLRPQSKEAQMKDPQSKAPQP